MELPVAIKDKIRQELELHFLLTYYVINSELIRLEKEKIELEKNLTLSAKVKNLLDIAKQTQANLQTMMKLRDQIEDEAKEAGFHDLSREHLEELTRDYIAQDPYYENRILLAIKLIVALPKDINATTKTQVFKHISMMLGFPKSTALSDLETMLVSNYRTLNVDYNAKIEDIVKAGAIASLVTAGFFGVVVIPFLGLGGAIATKIITTTTLAFLVGAAVAGIAYVINEELDYKKVIDEMYNLSPNELSSVLAFNSTVVNYMIKLGVSRDHEIIKKRLDLYVQLNHKVNTAYYLENEDKLSNAAKKTIINRCDKLLIKAV